MQTYICYFHSSTTGELESMYVSSSREDKAKLNARRIQAEIIRLLQENRQGLHFNEIFRQLRDQGLLNNNNILVSNLQQLMLKGLVKKTEVAGGGFGKSIYRWVGQDAHDLEGHENPNFDYEISGTLPFVLSAKFDKRGELEEVHIEKGKKDDFREAVRTLNAISKYCRPVNLRMSKMEKKYFASLLGNVIKLLQIQSSILREDDPTKADAAWQLYLSIVMSRFEFLFKDFALYASYHSKDKMMRNAREMRKKLLEICSAIVMKKPTDLDRVTIHETSHSSNIVLQNEEVRKALKNSST